MADAESEKQAARAAIRFSVSVHILLVPPHRGMERLVKHTDFTKRE